MDSGGLIFCETRRVSDIAPMLRFCLSLAAGLLLMTAHVSAQDRSIVFLGDSLSAGYGLDNAATSSFPALIEAKIKEAGLRYTVINAGVSGDTSAGGLRRVDWLLRRPIAVLVLELGGNDGLRGIAPSETQRNLQAIIEKVKAKNPEVKVLVAGMKMPPNLGAEYVASFAAIFPAVAEANKAALMPYLLEGVGGSETLNQRDRIHPTAAGHKVIAEALWPALKPLL